MCVANDSGTGFLVAGVREGTIALFSFSHHHNSACSLILGSAQILRLWPEPGPQFKLRPGCKSDVTMTGTRELGDTYCRRMYIVYTDACENKSIKCSNSRSFLENIALKNEGLKVRSREAGSLGSEDVPSRAKETLNSTRDRQRSAVG